MRDRGQHASASSAVEGAPSPPAPALTVKGLAKVFPGTRALDGVDLVVKRGEIHALCGGNGSGKSTLIKILCGVYRADSGTVTINGEQLDASEINPEQSAALGIRVVHQDLALFPDLSVMENMMLGVGFPTSGGRISWSAAKKKTQELIRRFDIPAKPQDCLRKLPLAARTQVAIARALQSMNSEAVVILDEPTAALAAHEVHLLHETIRNLSSQGHAVLFVSHRLDEVLSLTDSVTVLRDGRVVGQHRTSELTEAQIIESILGSPTERLGAARRVPSVGEPVLTVNGLTAGPLSDISLEVRAGEIVGVAGLAGSGRTELLRAIAGDLTKMAGSVFLKGRPVNFGGLGEAFCAGVALIPEDRHAQGVFPGFTVDENMSVSNYGKYWRVLGFRRSALRRDNEALRRRFRIKTASGSAQITALSGGNQQKTVIARWLRRDPVLLLLDEPSQGVDVGARNDIFTAVRGLLDAGGAALLVTSDLEELAQAADRAVVLRRGRIVAEVSPEDLNAHRLNELIYAGDR